ncbi:MAG: hypothetical protein J2P33_08330, partial [Actinobacteria bacterium]|nr:hypothetical protein [Actinomycetota bacterium]
ADDAGRADQSGAADGPGGPGRGEGEVEAEGVGAARTAGDMLAVAVIAVTGLGLVRSFTAAALVAGHPYSWAFAAAVAVGFAVTVLPWLTARGPLQDLAAYFDRRYHSTGWQRTRNGISPRRTGTTDERRSPSLLLAIFAAPFVIADVLLIFLPLAATHWLGVLATMVIALGTLAAGLAVLAYLVQSRRPLPVFALLRLRATPVFTLIVIIGLVGGALDTSSRLHDIRLPAAVAGAAGHVPALPRAAPALAGSLSQWLADPATRSCARAVPADPGAPAGGVRVEPLILVAAAGGGIRAAWWTVRALSALAATGCGRHAVFAASGVSGGSIGLAILGTTAARDAAVARIAGPDGLAAATDGLLLRDTIAGLAGLDLTAAGMPPGQRFPDRAALIERAWETEDPALAEPFPLRRPALPWRLMFNSTAVGTGCRAVIADRRIAPAPTAPAASSPSCGLSSGAPLPDGYDFFAEYPCLAGLDTATAALLSARFPYVTPSGVVNGCGRLAGTQLEQYVDGGYADSSGLATLAGLAPQLMPVIRQYNTDAVASARPGRPVTLVLPVVVYLGNSPQPEPVTGTAARSPSQPLIPLASGAASAQGQLTSSATLLQQLSGDISAAGSPTCGQASAACQPREQWLACATADSRCAADQAAAGGALRQQVIVVTPREFPAVTAPLGWVLSPASRLALNRALATETAGRCPRPAQNQEFCPAGIGRLGDLLRMINGG